MSLIVRFTNEDKVHASQGKIEQVEEEREWHAMRWRRK